MPYKIVRYQNGFRVKDINGRVYSQRALPYKKAIAQIRALYFSEFKKKKR